MTGNSCCQAELPRLRLFIIFFLTGLCSTMMQTILLREIMVVVMGNEFIIGICLFHWLCGIFAGSWLGSRTESSRRSSAQRLCFSLLILIVLAPLILVAVRNFYVLTATPPGLYISFFNAFFATAAVLLPFSFVIGFCFPLAAAVGNRQVGLRVIGFMSGIYIIESAGSLCAGALLSYLVLGRWTNFFTLFLFFLPLSLVLLRTALGLGKKPLLILAVTVTVLNAVCLVPGVHNRIDQATVEARWHNFSPARLVRNQDSAYQNIALGYSSGQWNLFLNGNLAEVFPNQLDNRLLAARLLAQHPRARRILILGQAQSGLAQAFLEYPIQELVCIEIDPRAADLVVSHLTDSARQALKDPRFKLILDDGRYHIAAQKSRATPDTVFDLVFLRVSEPSSLLSNRFYTRDFFQELAPLLGPGGVVCLKITSSENYSAGLVSDYTATVFKTLQHSFPHTAVSPGMENFFFASPAADTVTTDTKKMMRRLISLNPGSAPVARLLASFYPREKTDFITRSLQAHSTGHINSDDLPLAVFLFNKTLGWHQGRLSSLWQWLNKKVSLRNVLGLVFFAGLLYTLAHLFFPTPKRRSNRILVMVTAAGFSGISLELIILTLVQNKFGYIYQYLGIFIALFMAGLPLGAGFARQHIRHRPRHGRTLQFLLLGLGLMAAFIIPLSSVLKAYPAAGQLLAGTALVATGFLVGAIFPVALELKLTYSGPARSAGTVNAADHAGAALGAILSASVLIPLLGIRGSALVLVCTNTLIAVITMITDRPGKR